MSEEEIKALERRFLGEWNEGKTAAMAVIDELCATDFVFHGGGEEIRGRRTSSNRWASSSVRFLTISPPLMM